MSHARRPLLLSAVLALVAVLAAALAVVPADAAGKKGTARWDVASYVSGTDKLQVHGTLPGGRRKIVLQVRTKSGWQGLKTKRTKGDGSYRLRARLDWIGTHKVRVVAAGRPAFARTTKAVVSPGYTPNGDAADHHLLYGDTVAKAWRFNPCQTIRYQINPGTIGASVVPLVQQAVEQASRASGIPVRYTGLTDYLPFSVGAAKRTPKGADLVVGFGTDQQVPKFRGPDGTVVAGGFGGPIWGVPARDAAGRKVTRTDDAGVVIRTESYQGGYVPSFESAGNAPIGNLLLHEVGHALGLDHAAGADQMMYANLWNPDSDGVFRSRYAAGDFAGLDKVGLGQGCLRPLRNGRVSAVPAPAPLP